MSIIDPVLDHIEKRIADTKWSYEELQGLNIKQLAAVDELIQTALTETRNHFKNATIGIKQ